MSRHIPSVSYYHHLAILAANLESTLYVWGNEKNKNVLYGLSRSGIRLQPKFSGNAQTHRIPHLTLKNHQKYTDTAKILDPPNESPIFFLCCSLTPVTIFLLWNPITFLQFPIDPHDPIQLLKICRKIFLCCGQLVVGNRRIYTFLGAFRQHPASLKMKVLCICFVAVSMVWKLKSLARKARVKYAFLRTF
jgi:hypothetical protein